MAGVVWLIAPHAQTLADGPTGSQPAAHPLAPGRAAEEPVPEKVRLARLARQFRGIRTGQLDSRLADVRERGRARVLELLNADSIGPFAQELMKGGPFSRSVLVEGLVRFDDSETATLQLATLTLIETEPSIRAEALAELRRRRDPRVAYLFQEALYAGNDVVVGRAADALAALQFRGAVPDLIKNLTVDRRQAVQRTVPLAFTGMQCAPGVCAGGSAIGWGGGGYATGPGFAFSHADNALLGNLVAVWRVEPVTVMRTEVREALRQLTGQDFGFDVVAWGDWYQAHAAQEDPE